MKIFISCSARDRGIADILMAYLNRCFDIKYRDMYNCFAGEDRNPLGDRFSDYIRDSIITSDTVILIISHDALKSKYCLCELGAAWALKKKAIMIFVAPTVYEDLMDTPMAGIEALSVDLRNKESSRNLLNALRRQFSALQKESIRSEYNTILNQIIDDLYRVGFMCEKPASLLLSNVKAFHENGDSSTLKLLNIENDLITARIDFFSSQPQYVGFAIDLKYADWSAIMSSDYALSFTIDARATINSVTVEFKNKHPEEELNKFAFKKLNLLNNRNDIHSIKLKGLSSDEKNWENMKELVFLFAADDVDEVGTFTLKNLEFKK